MKMNVLEGGGMELAPGFFIDSDEQRHQTCLHGSLTPTEWYCYL